MTGYKYKFGYSTKLDFANGKKKTAENIVEIISPTKIKFITDWGDHIQERIMDNSQVDMERLFKEGELIANK